MDPIYLESPRELRHRFHGNKINRGSQFWFHRIFIHIIPSYLTWLFIRTPITANQITIAMVLVGLAGAIMLALPGTWAKAVGFLLIYVGIALDGLDGDIARFRNTFSLRGIYLDDIQHMIIPPLFFGALAFDIARVAAWPEQLVLYAAFAAGLSLIVIKTNGKEPFHLLGKHVLRDPHNYADQHPVSVTTQQQVPRPLTILGLVRKILAVRYQLRQFLFILIIFVVAFIVEQIAFDPATANSHPIISALLIGYGAFLTLHAIEEVIKHYFHIDGWTLNLYRDRVENSKR